MTLSLLDGWFKATQAAIHCGVKRTTLQRWIASGLPREEDGTVHTKVVRGWAKWIAAAKPKNAAYKYNERKAPDSRGGVIYAWVDPRPERKGEIRYIGQAMDFAKRQRDYRRMWNGKGKRTQAALANWFDHLKGIGLTPTLIKLDECLIGLDSLEIEWIAKGRAKGWDLLNGTNGGSRGSHGEHSRKLLSENTKRLYATDPMYMARVMAGRLGIDPAAYIGKQDAHVETHRKADHAEKMRRCAERKARPKPEPVKRKIRIEGDIAYVALTRGYEAMVDVADADRVGKHLWNAQEKSGGVVRAKNKSGLLSRFVLGISDPSLVVRFRDRDTLNCRRKNLYMEQVGVSRTRFFP